MLKSCHVGSFLEISVGMLPFIIPEFGQYWRTTGFMCLICHIIAPSLCLDVGSLNLKPAIISHEFEIDDFMIHRE